MKKTYIQPSIEEIKIETMNLLSASSPEVEFDPTDTTGKMDSRALDDLLDF